MLTDVEIIEIKRGKRVVDTEAREYASLKHVKEMKATYKCASIIHKRRQIYFS